MAKGRAQGERLWKMKIREKSYHIKNIINVFLKLKLSRKKQSCKKEFLEKWYCPSKIESHSHKLKITWIGQATFLIQIAGINILTDPIFFSPSIFVNRICPPGIELSQLSKIDYVLISHDHRDHLDKKSLLAIKNHQPKILAPKNACTKFFAKNFKNFCELNWKETHTQNFCQHNRNEFTTVKTKLGEIKFTFLKANHWSGRNIIFDLNKSPCGSWMIEYNCQNNINSKTIYFAGDTAYGNHFTEIFNNFKNIDLALLPIGPIEPNHIVVNSHLNSKQAIQSFFDLNAKQFIPMHWGTFEIGTENFDEPINQLQYQWKLSQEKLKNKKLIISRIGECLEL